MFLKAKQQRNRRKIPAKVLIIFYWRRWNSEVTSATGTCFFSGQHRAELPVVHQQGQNSIFPGFTDSRRSGMAPANPQNPALLIIKFSLIWSRRMVPPSATATAKCSKMGLCNILRQPPPPEPVLCTRNFQSQQEWSWSYRKGSFP